MTQDITAAISRVICHAYLLSSSLSHGYEVNKIFNWPQKKRIVQTRYNFWFEAFKSAVFYFPEFIPLVLSRGGVERKRHLQKLHSSKKQISEQISEVDGHVYEYALNCAQQA